MHLKRSSAKWCPFCPGGDELSLTWNIVGRSITDSKTAFIPIMSNLMTTHLLPAFLCGSFEIFASLREQCTLHSGLWSHAGPTEHQTWQDPGHPRRLAESWHQPGLPAGLRGVATRTESSRVRRGRDRGCVCQVWRRRGPSAGWGGTGTATVTSQWARWHLKSPVSLLFTQLFVRAAIIENIKDPRYWPIVRRIHRSPLWGESTGDRWILLTMGQ